MGQGVSCLIMYGTGIQEGEENRTCFVRVKSNRISRITGAGKEALATSVNQPTWGELNCRVGKFYKAFSTS